jgi:hypothetical protein
MCEYAVMRTTLNIPDNVIKKSKIMAIQEGVALKKIMTWALKKEVTHTDGPRLTRKSAARFGRNSQH